MLQVFDLCKSFGGQDLFRGVTFAIGGREVIGLVGRNGCGKSTLFKIILEQETSDKGRVVIPKGYQIGYLDQHIHFTKDTLLEECCEALSADEKYETYKAERILFGLGFTQEDLERSPQEFSGGYQLRINLTKTLLKEPDLLLLDEPTNYLDIVSMRWMRKFLKGFRGEAVIITHDREFMDSVVTHTMGIHRGQVKKVEGPTEKYYTQLAMDEEIYEKTRQNQEKKVKEMEKFVEKFGAKASKASQAQSKLKAIQKISILDVLDSEASLGFRFNYKQTPTKGLMQVEDLGFSYTGNVEDNLFSNLSFDMKPTDRLAIIGKNGKGKTTLLNVLAGQLEPTSGSVRFHPSVAHGYYQQTHRKDLKPNNTVADEIGKTNVDLDVSAVRSICGAMMFPGDDALKKIKVLSGGEQGRVLLGKILAKPANLLLLDEPSNHLDMESIEVLVRKIDEFKGGVVLVTHNEQMLRQLATKLIIFHRGGADVFLGGYDEFLEKIGWEDDEKNKKTKSKNKKDKRKKGQLVNERSRQLKPLKKQQQQLEKSIEELEAQVSEKNKDVLEKISASAPGDEIQKIYKVIGDLQIQLETQYGELQKTTDKLDAIETEFAAKMS